MLRFQPGLMRAVVDFQRDDQKAPLPPPKEIFAHAEEYIAGRCHEEEERLHNINAAVLPILKKRSDDAVAALRGITQRISADASFSAANGQLENIEGAEEDLDEMYDRGVMALKRSRAQLQQKKEHNQYLRSMVQNVTQTMKRDPGNQVNGFLQEVAEKSSYYVGN